MKMLVYLFYLCIFSLIIGSLGVLPLGIPQVNIYLTDIIVGLIGLIWLTRLKIAIKLVRTDKIAISFCIFVGVVIISLIFSPINLSISEKLVSGLYIVRLVAYFFVYLTIRFLTGSPTPAREYPRGVPQAQHHPWGGGIAGLPLRLLTSIGLILAALGWTQYFLYPDLRNLYYLGWDPHFARIFSTYLDPNYFGLMMVLTLISLFYYSSFTWKESLRNTLPVFVRTPGRWILPIFVFVTLMFTYSRSSFLALIGAAIYFFVAKKKFKLLSGSLLLIFIGALLLPRPGGAGVQLERVFSIETRIENWQQAFKIFTDYPVLGVGFNTIRYAKSQYNFGQDNLAESHAGAGFDNSFLFIAATTGILGLLSYLFFLRKIFRRGNLLVKSSIMAMIIHSFFLNSLFFPWVMIWSWIIVAVGTGHSGERSDTRIDSGQARMT